MNDLELLEQAASTVSVSPEHVRIRGHDITIYGFQENLKYLVHIKKFTSFEMHSPKDVINLINQKGVPQCHD